MFPYKDENPTLSTPVVTIFLIGVNIAVWVLIQGMGADPALARSVCELGLIPGEFLGTLPAGTTLPMGRGIGCVLTGERAWITPLSSMFLHGGWFHLIGNMWFLWVFGNNVEDSMGRGRFLAFYVLCGFAAAAVQTFLNPASPIPMVGASGAISGVMGAYVLLYPRVQIRVLVVLIIFFTRIRLPAFVMLGLWFGMQLLGGAAAAGSETGGVAFGAHVGGFIAGAILIPLFQNPGLVAQHRALARTM